MPWYWVCRGSAWANLQSLTASDTDDLDSWHTPTMTCEVLQLLQSMDAGELRVLAANLIGNASGQRPGAGTEQDTE